MVLGLGGWSERASCESDHPEACNCARREDLRGWVRLERYSTSAGGNVGAIGEGYSMGARKILYDIGGLYEPFRFLTLGGETEDGTKRTFRKSFPEMS